MNSTRILSGHRQDPSWDSLDDALVHAGFTIETVYPLAYCPQRLEEVGCDAVLLDAGLAFEGKDVVNGLWESKPGLPVILVSRTDGESSGFEALFFGDDT